MAKKHNFNLVLGILLTLILILPCFGATGLCNGVGYDKDIYRCEFGELIGKCKGKDYYVAYDKCVNGIVVNGTASSNNSSTFTDSRDGKTYKWVKIGKQTWMAENLNYATSDSKCPSNKESNCDKYGRLYNWYMAKTVCPRGWHLPSNADWSVLMKFVNPSCSDNKEECAGAGTKLKATDGWGISNNGNDKFGFSALGGGYGLQIVTPNEKLYGFSALPDGSYFNHVGKTGYWWSATEINAGFAYGRLMDHDYEDVSRTSLDKPIFQSVRCVQD